MSITHVTLSDKAKELFAQGLGQENLEAFLAADVADKAVDVLEINGGNETVASALQIGGTLTVAELANKFETAVAEEAAEEQQQEQPQSGLTEAQIAANQRAADAAKAAGAAGTEVSTTAQSPAPVVEAAAPEAPAQDLQAQPAESAADPEPVSGLVEPDWIGSLSATAKAFKGAFDKYVAEMRPKRPVEPVAAARNQVVLVRTLCSIINLLEGEEFHKVFNYVLQQFALHRDGSLRELAIFRSIEVNQLNAEQGKLFPRLINMLILTADPATRATGLTQVDIGKTLAGELITEEGRRRVFQFFGK